jgi:hypothetical protein
VVAGAAVAAVGVAAGDLVEAVLVAGLVDLAAARAAGAGPPAVGELFLDRFA